MSTNESPENTDTEVVRHPDALGLSMVFDLTEATNDRDNREALYKAFAHAMELKGVDKNKLKGLISRFVADRLAFMEGGTTLTEAIEQLEKQLTMYRELDWMAFCVGMQLLGVKSIKIDIS